MMVGIGIAAVVKSRCRGLHTTTAAPSGGRGIDPPKLPCPAGQHCTSRRRFGGPRWCGSVDIFTSSSSIAAGGASHPAGLPPQGGGAADAGQRAIIVLVRHGQR